MLDKFLIVLLVVLTLASCHKDSLNEGETGSTTVPPGISLAKTGNILGIAYDQEGNPIPDAEVSLDNQSTTTDAFGVFRFKDIDLDPHGSFIKVAKDGYFLGSDVVYGGPEGTMYSRIMMISDEPTGTFDADAGGETSIIGGGKIVFAPGSIVDAEGNNYSGTVKVSAHLISSDDDHLYEKMPGALVGTNENGATVVLGTAGMVVAELHSSSGEKLNIKEGMTAEIRLPVGENLTSAPGQIDLWSFDENKGLWIHEGKASKNGNEYIAQVGHFSFWNCDLQYPLIKLKGRVLYEDGTPVKNAYINLQSQSLGAAGGFTNAEGYFCGKVPKGEELTLTIPYAYASECNHEPVTLGPFEADVMIDDIIIDLPDGLIYSGTVVCGGQPVENATVFYEYDGYPFVVNTDGDGMFVFDFLNCNIDHLNVRAYNPATGDAGPQMALDLVSQDGIVLEICSNCDFGVDLSLDTSIDSCETRVLRVDVTGLGTYTYAWSTGSTETSVNVDDGGVFCVTVTDEILGCEKIKCSEQSPFRPLDINFEVSYQCSNNTANIFLFLSGGYPPYTINLNGETILTDTVSYNVLPGDYNLEVTDKAGCTASTAVTIEERVPLSIDFTIEYNCNSAILTPVITGGLEPYSIAWSPSLNNDNTAYQSGTYCMTVSDEQNCYVQVCKEVDIPILDGELLVEGCSKNEFTVVNTYPEMVTFESSDNQVSIDLFPGENVINILDKKVLPSPYGTITTSEGCVLDGFLPMPLLVNETNDDIVYYTFDNDINSQNYGIFTIFPGELTLFTPLNGASPGGIIILDESFNVVTEIATEIENQPGTYYVVIVDGETGCYLYYEKVIVE